MAPAAPASGGAERRQLTVLFVDLVESTRLADGLDPEDWREVVRAYQEACAEVLERHGGHIAQYLGDGLLVYFGYPQAREDEAERAVRAGLDIMTRLAELDLVVGGSRHLRLEARIGVHSGPVVVGEIGAGGRRDTLALGGTVNVAARLQGIAQPGRVVISAQTLRLVQGLFLLEDLGSHVLKGLADPVPAYQVVRPSGVASRLDVASIQLTPFVARDQELSLLLDHWEQVRKGSGRTALVSGDAGIGKSRLMRALRERLAEVPHTWLECRASPYTRDSAFQPIIDLVERGLGFEPEDPEEARLDRLERSLVQAGCDPAEAVPLIASLLSLPVGDRYVLPPSSPAWRKRKTLDTLVQWLLALCRMQPVLLLVEDLHWIDPSSLELIGRLVDEAPEASLLLALTHRPSFEPSWDLSGRGVAIPLSGLTRDQAAQIVHRVAGETPVPSAILRRIIDRTDGVPLFVEELTKTVAESGLLGSGAAELSGGSLDRAIPETLQDSLMARLDALRGAKELAQLCATLGREFSHGLLAAVSPLDDESLARGLAQLVETELLFQQGEPPRVHYLFKHALIQDTAYESLLRAKRRQFHGEIAAALEQHFPDTVASQPELIAHHHTEAGNAEAALGFWQRAARRAVERSAGEEALAHVARGLAVLDALPEAPGRHAVELDLRMLRGMVMSAARGYGAVEVEESFARARELCAQLGETPELFPVLYGLWLFHMARADHEATDRLARQLLQIADGTGDAGLRLQAHIAEGVTRHWCGELAPALEHLQRAADLYDPERHRHHAFLYGQDPGAAAVSIAGTNLAFMGYLDQAMEHHERALAMAEQLGHPYSLVSALNFYAQARNLRRDPKLGLALAQRSLELSAEQGFFLYEAGARNIVGGMLIQLGQRAEGIELVREGLAMYRQSGSWVGYVSGLINLSRGHLFDGSIDAGLEVIEEGLGLVKRGVDPVNAPELMRVRGELLRARPGDGAAEAEASFRDALSLARSQGARTWELRTATSLARLCQEQGKTAEAREVLAPVCGWFTEGLDSSDVVEGVQLLDELA